MNSARSKRRTSSWTARRTGSVTTVLSSVPNGSWIVRANGRASARSDRRFPTSDKVEPEAPSEAAVASALPFHSFQLIVWMVALTPDDLSSIRRPIPRLRGSRVRMSNPGHSVSTPAAASSSNALAGPGHAAIAIRTGVWPAERAEEPSVSDAPRVEREQRPPPAARAPTPGPPSNQPLIGRRRSVDPARHCGRVWGSSTARSL